MFAGLMSRWQVSRTRCENSTAVATGMMYSSTRKMRSRSVTASRSSRRRFWRAPLRRSSSAHVEQLEDHEVVLDLVAHRRRDEAGAVAFARARAARRCSGDPGRARGSPSPSGSASGPRPMTPLLQTLDRDRAAQRGLRFDPALLAEVRLREPAGAELDRHARSRRRRTRRCGCARRTASAARSRPRPASSAGRAACASSAGRTRDVRVRHAAACGWPDVRELRRALREQCAGGVLPR